jgi:UDP-N-acetylglucosamine/UDP-N-acetylgalactosamine 4-epimerase
MYNTVYHDRDLTDLSFLVTGGAGFIGSNIVEYLLNYGAQKVRVLDNFSTGFMHNLEEFAGNPAFELIEGDIRDPETCAKAVKDINYVTHQAALGSVPRSINDPITTNGVNISGFLNMLVAARDANVNRFVYAASSSTYGDHSGLPKFEDKIGQPLSPYAVTKYVNELYASVFSKTYGFHTIGLRYFNVFGPKQSPTGAYAAVIPLFIQAALNKTSPVINGDGTISRDFTFVENAIQANIEAMFARDIEQHEVFNIAFGEKTTLNELWQRICEIIGIDLSPEYGAERKGDIKHSLADISKGKKMLNYQPRFSVNSGLELTCEWYKGNLK